jgi:glycosyltransferase involved in cell wall biosynthesis/Tfp pilus assembly protein PilF
LAATLVENPNVAALHNALGLVVAKAEKGRGPLTAVMAERAAGYFQRALTSDPNHLVSGLNLAEVLVGIEQKQAAIDQARRTLEVLSGEQREIATGGPLVYLDDAHFPPAFDLFRVEWERTAWANAGCPLAEAKAKKDLLRWRLHLLLAELTGDLSHYFEAALYRPDLGPSRAALGCALGRAGRLVESVDHLRRVVNENPFDLEAARALFQALGAAGDGLGQRRLAASRRLLARAARQAVPEEEWFLKAAPPGDELASIIILCCNQLEYNRLCLDSVLRHTRPPYELILVDNASTDGTREFLEDIKSATSRGTGMQTSVSDPRSSNLESPPVRVEVIRNETNRGYPAGCNQGLARARGRYLVFLNNDTVVTEAWLEGLIAWALFDWPKVGLVGAVTNSASEPQRIPVDYHELDSLPAFAARRCKEYAGQALQVQRLTGFCLLVRREVFDHIGSFDEQFGLGFFDDDDLCVRARDAGFQLLVAQNVFVHHFGNRTFRALGVDCRQQLLTNFERFKTKWGTERAVGYRLPDWPNAIEQAPSVSSNSQTKVSNRHRTAKVSLCMIMKNEEKHLADCLEPVRALFNEIVMVDTGSTDDTRNIAARFGSKVVDFAWTDSFAAARNESVRHATGDWIFWLDADDRLDPENLESLRSLLDTLSAPNVAYFMAHHSLSSSFARPAGVVQQIRLFPNHPEARWEKRVHEQILPSLQRLGTEIRLTEIVIRHLGFKDESLLKAKCERNLRLLLVENSDCPDDPFTLSNLGGVYLDSGQPREALPFLERGLEKAPKSASWLPDLHLMVAQAQHNLGRKEEALAACREARRLFPDHGPLLFAEASILHDLGRLTEAEQAVTHLVETKPAGEFLTEDPGLRGSRGRHLLATVYQAQGRLAEAKAQWRLALEERPDFLPAQQRLEQTVASDQRSVVSNRNETSDSVSQIPQAIASAHDSARSNCRLANTVSLCMIVKNEEANLPACLESAADLFDEIVIVDTGSTDRTKDLAGSFGARVYDFAWVDSFAAARNECLRHAQGEWIFWLDADDRLTEENRQKLKNLFARLEQDRGNANGEVPGSGEARPHHSTTSPLLHPLAYSMKCLCLPDPQSRTATVVDHVRLFRNQPEIRWRYRVHEQILPAVRQLGGLVSKADVIIQHIGYLDPALRAQKHERDLRLLLLDHGENPDDPFILFNLGWVYSELRRPKEALPYLNASLARSQPGDSIVHKLFALIVQCHRQADQWKEALEACRNGRKYYPDDVELLFQEGLVRREQGDRLGAENCWSRILQTKNTSHFGSVDVGLAGYKTRHNLAVIYEEQGRLAEAEAQWQAALTQQPDYLPACLGLAEVYLHQHHFHRLGQLIAQLDSVLPGSIWPTVLTAKAHLARREFPQARHILEEALTRFPREVTLWVVLSHALLQEGKDWQAAEQVLQRVLELEPGNTEAQNNLAALLHQQGRSVQQSNGHPPALSELYRLVCTTPSDINEHLPTLCSLAMECRHVTEMGTRMGVSTTAFLFAQPDKLVCYDHRKYPQVDQLQALAGRTEFVFNLADVLKVAIEETDLLFIDTLHDYEQLQQELFLHGSKVRKYLVLHDTTTFGQRGETLGHRGLWPAVEEFLALGSFRLKQRYENNHGLTILERVEATEQFL